MKYLIPLALAASAVSALSIGNKAAPNQNVLVEDEQYLIELTPGQTRWVTEEEKWRLRRVSLNDSCAVECAKSGRRRILSYHAHILYRDSICIC